MLRAAILTLTTMVLTMIGTILELQVVRHEKGTILFSYLIQLRNDNQNHQHDHSHAQGLSNAQGHTHAKGLSDDQGHSYAHLDSYAQVDFNANVSSNPKIFDKLARIGSHSRLDKDANVDSLGGRHAQGHSHAHVDRNALIVNQANYNTFV